MDKIIVFEGYGFQGTKGNQYGIVSELTKKDFNMYFKLLQQLTPLEDLFRTYQIMKAQSDFLFELPSYIDKHGMDLDELLRSLEFRITMYILAHRMFVDNCKNFKKRFECGQFQEAIDDLERKKSEQNIKVLRDYAIHSSLPMSDISLITSPSGSKPAEIKVGIRKNKMVQGQLSRFDRSIIESWPHGTLQIYDEIVSAKLDVAVMFKRLMKAYVDAYVESYLKDKVISDSGKWTELLSFKVDGVIQQKRDKFGRTKKGKQYRIDYDALSTFIATIVTE